MHIFTILFFIGASLVVVGMGSLLVLIPCLAKKFQESEARTEFYSAKAAYWSVIAGLAVLVILAISAAVFMFSFYHK